MRAPARIPNPLPPTTEDLHDQMNVLRELVAHLQERVEILEAGLALRSVAHATP